MSIVTGSAGADLLEGTGGNDTLAGLDGNDTLLAGAGDDRLDGGAGTDRASIDRSAASHDIILFMLAPALVSLLDGTRVTGVEHLSFTAGSGADGLVGGAGDDSLAGGAGHDALQGGAGADTLAGGDGADTLLGGPGADVLAGGAGADRFILQGSGGLDSSLAASDRILDFNAAEGDRLVLRGEAIGAALFGLAGRGFGLSGQPVLPVGFGGALAARSAPVAGMALPDRTAGAAHTVYWQPDAGSGGWVLLDLDRDGLLGAADMVVRIDLPGGQSISADSFVAGSFATLGGPTAESIVGGAAADSILGFGGNDTLAGLDGNDTLLGGAGNDSLLGGAGFDSLLGGDGADTLDGGAGTDVLDGGAGNDVLLGADGDDLLLGGEGVDLLVGGTGNDSLVGGPGADTLDGGPGADTLLLQGMGEAAWSTLAAMDLVSGFSRAEGDRLRVSNAWFGQADGRGADAGTYTGVDGIARALLFSGSIGRPVAAPVAGMALPAQPVDGYQLYWLPGQSAGGWLVLDLGRDGRLDATDLVVRLDGVAMLAPEDFVTGTFLTLAAGFLQAGTAGDDSLDGGSLGATFLGSAGNDRISGGAGAGNALSYAGLGGPISVVFTAHGTGSTAKPGGASDLFSGIHVLAGTAGADRLDACAAGGGFFALSLEGMAGADTIIGDGGPGVQVSYAASPAAIGIDLLGGGGSDGWGSTDTLVNIRRVAALSAFGDTVMGSAGDDVFLSGTAGNKTFDGRAGTDEWRYAGTGAITVTLASSVTGGIPQGAYVLKPGGTDRLAGIEVIAGGAGDDSITGSSADERLGGGAGRDTLDGGAGHDIVFHDFGGLATRGVVVNLATGTALDQWGGADVLRNIESAWGTRLADDLTGRSVAGTRTWLRGLAGNDTLRAPAAGTQVGADYAGDPAGIIADLGAGTVSDGWGGIDTLHAIGLVRGTDFADRITGGADADTLLGGAGADTLDGGGGADLLEGGPGNDLYLVDHAQDLVAEAAGEGEDTIIASLGMTLPAQVETLVLSEAAGNATGIGNALDNLLLGNAGANRLEGGAGNDTLQGSAGNDTLVGWTGDDLLEGGDGKDVLSGGSGADTLLGGDGDDTIIASADGRFTGRLWLDIGQPAPWAIDLVEAATFADVVDGGAGTDTWTSGVAGILLDLRALPLPGIEWLRGTSTDDALLLARDQPGATVVGGGGQDTLSGSDQDDRLEGNDGDDLLAGHGGHDTLHGGAGADTMVGGTGDDLYVVDHAGDRAMELNNQGTDTVLSAVSYNLGGQFIEHLTLTGTGAINAIGNSLNNTLTGNAGNNRLSGGTGNDSLIGGAGHDTLDGGAGADTMVGGTGDDLYVVDHAGDRAMELNNQGTDTVLSAVSYNLGGQYIEHLTLTGSGATSAIGNSLDNTLTGNAGNNRLSGGTGNDSLIGGAGHDTLDGGAGADTMVGGTGDDLYVVDHAGDRAMELNNQGTDTVLSAVSYNLGGQFIEHLTLTGTGAINAIGNSLNNTLTGNAGNNRLSGGTGNDSLIGGAGHDTLDGGAGADTMVGGTGDDLYVVDHAGDRAMELNNQGTDTVLSAVSYNLGGQYIEHLTLTGSGAINAIGNSLNNILTGNAGDNLLNGGTGRDTLNGGGGDDVLAGGAGADTFLFGRGAGVDLISDFTPGTDHIRLSGLGFSSFAQVLAAAVEDDGTTMITLGPGDLVTLRDVALASLSAADFLFG